MRADKQPVGAERLTYTEHLGIEQEAAPAQSEDQHLALTVLGTLAYSDLFDYPLSVDEIVRYQIGTRYTGAETVAALETSPLLHELVVSSGGRYCLKGREAVFATRNTRGGESKAVWGRARVYSAVIARLPFVRMVAVTGALAVDNIGENPDIDLMVVTRPGRVWISRRLIIGLVRLARLRRDDLCPNYIISETSLYLEQQDVFTAHELAQMVPLYGQRVYARLLSDNAWAREYLPTAFEADYYAPQAIRRGPLRRIAEAVLAWKGLDRWDAWETARLRKKLRPLVGDAAEVICSPEQCKGHTGLHRQWVTSRFRERLLELGIPQDFADSLL
jgi:hypothetical protein